MTKIALIAVRQLVRLLPGGLTLGYVNSSVSYTNQGFHTFYLFKSEHGRMTQSCAARPHS